MTGWRGCAASMSGQLSWRGASTAIAEMGGTGVVGTVAVAKQPMQVQQDPSAGACCDDEACPPWCPPPWWAPAGAVAIHGISMAHGSSTGSTCPATAGEMASSSTASQRETRRFSTGGK